MCYHNKTWTEWINAYWGVVGVVIASIIACALIAFGPRPNVIPLADEGPDIRAARYLTEQSFIQSDVTKVTMAIDNADLCSNRGSVYLVEYISETPHGDVESSSYMCRKIEVGDIVARRGSVFNFVLISLITDAKDQEKIDIQNNELSVKVSPSVEE